jgi:hypothetical protein
VTQFAPRIITWSAHACDYSAANVNIGLAPGLEDVAVRTRLVSAGIMSEYPGKEVPITRGTGVLSTIPLRLYALRDTSACTVQRVGKGDVPGFHRTRITFDLPAFHPTASAESAILGSPSNGNSHRFSSGAASPDSEIPKVVAFLLAIGLSRNEETHFFNGIVNEFLQHSWSSIPDLLREVGCAEPNAA